MQRLALPATVVAIGVAIWYLRRSDKTKKEGGCCPPGSPGPLAADKCGGSVGKEVVADGSKAYVTGPTRTGRAILLVSDVWGWGDPKCSRVREVADQLAQGVDALVVVMDFFPGNPLINVTKFTDSDFFPKLSKWLKPYDWPTCSAVLEKGRKYAMANATNAQGRLSLGCVGFCWGNWVVMHACASGHFQAGVSMHPSHVFVSQQFGEEEAALVGAVKCPQMMLSASNDPPSVKPGGLAEKIWSEKSFGKDCYLEEYKDMMHGWTQRLDGADDLAVDAAQKKALTQGITFFKKYLKAESTRASRL
eukprot:g80080.t1